MQFKLNLKMAYDPTDQKSFYRAAWNADAV